MASVDYNKTKKQQKNNNNNNKKKQHSNTSLLLDNELKSKAHNRVSKPHTFQSVNFTLDFSTLSIFIEESGQNWRRLLHF